MIHPKGFFVTGTDTEIGKTLVSGALILKLRERGVNALGFKPVVAGTYQNAQGIIQNEDLETLRIASNLPPEQTDLCPYVLDTPAAPHLVAKHQNQHLDTEIMREAFKRIQRQSDCVVVEGAGGFLTPLNDHENLGDFVQQLELPIILVVGMKLGCINHALLTAEAIQSRKLPFAGWIANSLSTEMSFLDENIETLESRIQAPFLGHIPTLPRELLKSVDQPYSIGALDFAAQHIQLPAS